MRAWSRHFICAAIVIGLFTLVRISPAQTGELQFKPFVKVEPGEPDPDARFRIVGGQHLYFSIDYPSGRMSGGESMAVFSEETGGKTSPSFDEVIIQDRDDYGVPVVCRGVLQLGEEYYGYVLDKGPVEGPTKRHAYAQLPYTENPIESFTYSRLYLDFNHNGDLTDEEPLDAVAFPERGGSACIFPELSLQLRAAGEKYESAFTLVTLTNVHQYAIDVNCSLKCTGYREGEIVLEGKHRRVVLVDSNANGRYDDQASLYPIEITDGRLIVHPGDMFYIDPHPKASNLLGPDGGNDQFFVSNLIHFEETIYDVVISPSGKQLSLTPSDSPTGFAENPNTPYALYLWGDKGMFTVTSDALGRAKLPVGEWRITNYMLNRSDETNTEEAPTSVDEMMDSLTMLAGSQKDPQLFVVQENETIQLAFGGPFRPVVTLKDIRYSYSAAFGPPEPGSIGLSMTLYGIAGDQCDTLMISGEKPPPEFTITTPEGEFIKSGVFEYG